ncbi:MazG-like family protein [Piscibacillus sp. B03]|uniref:MazG-like family protein n=1 Tax=Piscibacillus sp. B03 TaxID=3457430 RepID=UPI003FCE6E82
MDLNILTTNIQQWAKDRGLNTAEPDKQTIKLGEEFGELCQGMSKKNLDQVIDSIGDMYVVLVILAEQLGLSIEDCIDQAYEEIKDRRGKMVSGVFVKDSDLG